MRTSTLERVLTPRLLCERVHPEHEHELRRLLREPKVSATLWSRPGIPTDDDVRLSLRANIEHWERHGFGMWLVRDRVSGEMVGRGGLQFTYTLHLDEIEAGWAVVPDRWGEGLATEIAWASVEAAFGTLDLINIIALALPDNVASRRVMEKTGFTYERDLIHAGLPHVLYRRFSDRG